MAPRVVCENGKALRHSCLLAASGRLSLTTVCEKHGAHNLRKFHKLRNLRKLRVLLNLRNQAGQFLFR